MKKGDWVWIVSGGVAVLAALAFSSVIFIAAAFLGLGGGSSSASTGGTFSGSCSYDQILAKVSDGKSLGESTAHGAPQQVPSQYVSIYTKAADDHKLEGCGASILAGIHSIETGFAGDSYSSVNSSGAGGPFQFLSATWASESQPPGGCGGTWPGYGVEKGACAAANYLHNSGAPKDWVSGIHTYNQANWYVYAVVLQAKHFASQTGQGVTAQ